MNEYIPKIFINNEDITIKYRKDDGFMKRESIDSRNKNTKIIKAIDTFKGMGYKEIRLIIK